MKKLIIQEASNGFIVHVKVTGESTFKDPYEKPVIVFETKGGLNAYLDGFFEGKGE